MKLVSLLFCLLCLTSCKTDDNDIDCTLFDPAFPSLFVRIVDNTGTNLIENGTIDPNNITVEGDFSGSGFQYIPANEFANPDADIREFDNTIRLYIPNESTFQYTIHLNNMDAISIDFSSELTRIPCDLFYFKPIDGTFNNETLELRDLSLLQFLAVIKL